MLTRLATIARGRGLEAVAAAQDEKTAQLRSDVAVLRRIVLEDVERHSAD